MVCQTSELAFRMGKLKARYVEDSVQVMKDAARVESLAPTKAEMESIIRGQLEDSRFLLDLAESACYQLASKIAVDPGLQRLLASSLGTVVNALLELREVCDHWMVANHSMLDGRQELDPLIAELRDRREELSFDRSVEMTFDPELTKQAREERSQGKSLGVGESINGLQVEISSGS